MKRPKDGSPLVAKPKDLESAAKPIPFGNVYLKDDEATGGFLYLGAPGSGKSVQIQLLEQSVLPQIAAFPDRRALVYDVKRNLLPLLASIASGVRVITSNPFDERGFAWDMCRDIREPSVAIEFVFTLMPQEHENQPFFSNAARHLSYGVVLSYLLAGLEWNFADFLRGVSSPKDLKNIIARHPETRSIVDRYFYDRKLVAHIMATLATKLLPFEPIAAAWETAKETFSIEDWARQNLILVLATSDSSRTPIDFLNRCISKRAFDITLGLPDSATRRTWIINDELAEAAYAAGGLDGLISVAKRGRSRGACIAAAIQSVSSLRDPKLYGQYRTDELLGLLANRFIGRLECPVTAEWGSGLFGEQEVEAVSTSTTKSAQGRSVTKSRQNAIRKTVLASELMTIPTCNRENGLTGYYITRAHGAFTAHVPGPELFDEELIAPNPSVPEFIPRDWRAQLLRPWTSEERRKFTGSETKPSAKAKRTRSRPKKLPDMWDIFGDED